MLIEAAQSCANLSQMLESQPQSCLATATRSWTQSVPSRILDLSLGQTPDQNPPCAIPLRPTVPTVTLTTQAETSSVNPLRSTVRTLTDLAMRIATPEAKATVPLPSVLTESDAEAEVEAQSLQPPPLQPQSVDDKAEPLRRLAATESQIAVQPKQRRLRSRRAQPPSSAEDIGPVQPTAKQRRRRTGRSEKQFESTVDRWLRRPEQRR